MAVEGTRRYKTAYGVSSNKRTLGSAIERFSSFKGFWVRTKENAQGVGEKENAMTSSRFLKRKEVRVFF